MKSEIISLYVTAGTHDEAHPAIATVGQLTLHCLHIQNRREVVLLVNPNITEYTPDLLEATLPRGARFQIFDIHRPATQIINVDGVAYEIEFLTWIPESPDTLRFDFEVRQD